MVKASVGTSVPSLLGKEALLDFKMDVSLDGESLDEAELQAHFMKRMDAFLAERGRVLVGWDEILPRLPLTLAGWRKVCAVFA